MAGIFEIVIIIVVLYCFFNSRASAMVDVLSARMQAVYTNWEQGPKSPPTRKVSANSLRRFTPVERRAKFRTLSSDSVLQYRDRELFRTKETPWILGFPRRPSRPVMGLACKVCAPESKEFSMDYANKSQDVQNILQTESEKSNSFFTRAFCHIFHVLQYKKFEFPQVSQKLLRWVKKLEGLVSKTSQTFRRFIQRAAPLMDEHRMKMFSFLFCIHPLKMLLAEYSGEKSGMSSNKVLTGNILRTAIEDTTKELVEKASKENPVVDEDELYKQIFTAQELRARKVLMDMRSTISDFLLRLFSWLLYKLFPRFLSSVCIHPSHLEMIQKAAKTNLPLIFVPLHRSHLDYILITFILQNINVKSPLVAAGNNLKIPVFGSLLRGLGAFFIKRRIDPVTGRKDILYRAILHTYMMECLRAGHNIEFYIEGGRTRTGKPCMPKGGLLSVIVGAYMDGTVEDALLVPMSVNYDKLVDGNFVNELLGQPKQMETFSSAISAIWTTLNSNYGSIRVDFNQPFSLKELVKSFQNMNKSQRLSQPELFSSNESDLNSVSKKNGIKKEKSFRSIPSTTSLYGTDVVDENHRALVDKIARHLIYDCAKACAVMSTNVLAFLLLNKFRDGVGMKRLTTAFEVLKKDLSEDHRDVGYTGETEDVIKHAIELLGPTLVSVETKKVSENSPDSELFISPVTSLPNVIGLSYYSYALLPHFMLEGVLATAIFCTLKSDSSSVITVLADDLMRVGLDLCDVFQYEFIFAKPCETLDFVLHDTIDKFKFMGIMTTQETINLEYDNWSHRVARNLEDSEDDEFYQYKPSPTYIINSGKQEEEKLQLYHMTFRHLIDAYLVTAMCLPTLMNKHLPEEEYVLEVLNAIQTYLDSGFCYFGESSSVELIKNSLKLFKQWGVVNMFNEDSKRFVTLTDVYSSIEEIQTIVKKIEFFRIGYEAS